MANTTSTRRRAAKLAPEPEVVEDEFEDMEEGDDIEELEDDAPVEKAEKPKRTPPVRPPIEHGSPWLAAYITENTDETYDARGIRMLLRKLAKDGKLARVVGEDRARYEFSGPKDPTVVAVLAMVKSGAAKALKQEGLQAVKDKAAAKKAAKAAAAPVEDDDEDVEDIEDDEAEEAPKPRTRRTAAKPTAPAKATPTTRRRTAAK
jgi:hypothetical protein